MSVYHVGLTILWICVAVFAATAVITILALIGKVRLGGGDGSKHDYYLRQLFKVLIVEVISSCLAFFAANLTAGKADDTKELNFFRDRSRLATEERARLEEENLKLRSEVAALQKKLTPAQPPKAPARRTLSTSIYVSSDRSQSDRKSIIIPPGWKYVTHTVGTTTANGEHRQQVDVDRVPGSQEATAVHISAHAAGKSLFGPRSWFGANLQVEIEEIKAP